MVGAVVGDGWYRGCIGLQDKVNYYGKKIKFLCVIYIKYSDGREEKITTDRSWRAMQNSPIRKIDLKTGEEYDANLEMPGWSKPKFDDSDWHEVYKGKYEGQLIPTEGERIIEHEHFSPKVIKTLDGNTVLDLGQNMSGYVKFRVH